MTAPDLFAKPEALYAIRYDIPPPRQHKTGRGRQCIYPWEGMELNASVLVPDWSVVRAAYHWADRHGVVFIARREKAKPYNIRIWRVA